MPVCFLSMLNTRTKMLVLACGAVTTIALSTLAAQTLLALVSLLFVLMTQRYRMIAFSYLVMAFMMLLSVAFTAILMRWIPALADMKASDVLVPFLRGVTMMNLVLSLALTSKIESVMGALTQLKLPFFVTLPTTVMVRFIPSFAHDVVQVFETLKIRGWPMSFSALLLHPLRTTRLLLIPILFRALRSSETLGIAAELKGLNASAVVRMGNEQRFLLTDWVVLIMTALVTVMAFSLEAIHPARVGMGM